MMESECARLVSIRIYSYIHAVASRFGDHFLNHFGNFLVLLFFSGGTS